MKKVKLFFISLLVFNFANAQERPWQDSFTNGKSSNITLFSGVESASSAGHTRVISNTIDTVDTWIPLSSGTTERLISVAFIDPYLGYAVGEHGTILKTTDGGTNWINLNSNTNRRLRSVCFSDTNTVFACGDFGTLLKSSDAGTTWDKMMVSSPSYNLDVIYFTDINTGYVAGGGGTLLKTTDAGLTWQVLPGGVAAGIGQPLSIFFTNPLTGYVADFGRVLKTTDAGVSWTSYTLNPSWMTSSVFFTDPNTGYVSSLIEIYKTVDAGATWTALGVGADQVIYSIFFTDSLTGYAAGDEGLLLKTCDAGLTWSPIVSGTTNDLRSLFFPNPCTGYVVGDTGTILKTTNAGGYDEIAISNVTQTDISCFNLADGTISISADGGTGVFQYSIDGGVTWFSNNGIFGSLAPGNYTIMVKDGCDHSSTYIDNPVTITEPSAVIISEVVKTDVSYLGGNDGTITINAVGGIAPLKYSIDNGATWQLNQNFTGLTAGIYFVVVMDSNNCESVYLNNPVVITEPQVSVSNLNKADEFTIYPNPATSKIVLSTLFASDEYIVSISNLRGQLLRQDIYGNQSKIEIDISALSAGIYIIKLQTDKSIETKKLIVQ